MSSNSKRRRTTQSLKDLTSSDEESDMSEYERQSSSSSDDDDLVDLSAQHHAGEMASQKRKSSSQKVNAGPKARGNGNGKKESLQQKSPAEFFADNKNIAGFDNPGKCLYTTVRELVENSLDSAESINQLPNVEIIVQEMSQEELNVQRGVANMGRVDEALYQDYETEQERQKREEKHRKEMERMIQNLKKRKAPDDEVEQKKRELVAKQQGASTGRNSNRMMFYKVTVRDNGMGMKHAEIPDMLGRVLSGTKYGVKQTRGKFGLGAKMALIWSKMSTGLPIEIYSARPGSRTKSYYKLDIDIRQNLPNVHECAELPNEDGWHGAELSVTISGTAMYYRAKILKYLQQIAVITPYAEFSFDFKGEDERNSFKTTFERRTSVMPPGARGHQAPSELGGPGARQATDRGDEVYASVHVLGEGIRLCLQGPRGADRGRVGIRGPEQPGRPPGTGHPAPAPAAPRGPLPPIPMESTCLLRGSTICAWA